MKFTIIASLAILASALLLDGVEETETIQPTSRNTLYQRTILPSPLPAGSSWITTEIRADSPSPNASIAVYAETEPRTSKNPALWQSVSVNSQWTKVTLPITMERSGKAALVFNKHPDSGTFSGFQYKKPQAREFQFRDKENILLNNGFFSGKTGETPAQWRVEYGYTKECGLTGEFGFENSSMVMKLSAGPDRAVSLQGMKYPLPRKGRIELTVWARALNDSAQMTLHLIGDSYAWGKNKSFSLNRNWQKFSFRAEVPPNPKSPFFWPRIDIAKGEAALIGKISLCYENGEIRKNVVKGKNLIFNPDFLFGTLGWQLRADEGQFSEKKGLKQMLRNRPPRRISDTLILDAGTMLQSRQFSVVPGEEYTVLLRMKNAVPGKNAECQAYLFDGKWQGFAGKFKLTDEYQTYRFSGKAAQSLYNRMYLRLDALGNAIQIDKVQAAAGTDTELEEPDLTFGILGNSILADTDRNAPLDVRVVMGKNRKKPLNLKMEIRDAWGNLCRRETFHFQPKRDQQKRFTVNPDGKRGVYHVTLSAENQKTFFRYAVLKDLSKLTLSEPPLAGHLSPVILKFDRETLNRFLGFNQMTYTRFFGKEILDLDHDPELKKTFQKHHTFNVLCLPELQDAGGKFSIAQTLTPELERQFAEQIRKTVAPFKGAIQGVELFNEPELWKYQKGEKKNLPTMSPQKVARYYQIARKVIREIDPTIRILGPVAWRDYGLKFLESGGADAIDIYAFHGYCESPSLFNLYGKIMDYRRVLKEKFGRDIPIWNTEQYFGFRGSGLPDHDIEVSRQYFKDTELEHAAVCVDNLIHHAAAGSKWSSMVLGYFLHGIPGQKEQMVFDSLAAVNAAQEFLSNAGRGEELNLGEAVKSFVFPNAPGGALVTLCTLDPATKGSMTIPKTVQAFDLFGNRIQSATAPVSIAPIYLRIPAKNWKAILNNLEFRDLGAPFALRLSMGGKDALNLTLSNRTNKSEQLEVELTGIPKAIQLGRTKAVLTLAPGEKRILSFPILQSDMRPMERYEFKATLRSRFGLSTERTSLSVLFAPRSANGRDVPWISLSSDNLSANYNPTEKWSGNDDLSAAFRTWWNRDGFGLSVRVHDNRFVFPDNAPAAWQNDSIQVYFDMKRDATPTSGKEGKNEGDDCDYILSLLHGKTPVAYLNHGSDARFIGEGNQTRGIDSALQLSCERPDAHTLIYHVFFPAATLPYISFREGSSFGFSLLINDDDGKGRKDGLTLAPKGTEPFRNPHLYKDLVLIP